MTVSRRRRRPRRVDRQPVYRRVLEEDRLPDIVEVVDAGVLPPKSDHRVGGGIERRRVPDSRPRTQHRQSRGRHRVHPGTSQAHRFWTVAGIVGERDRSGPRARGRGREGYANAAVRSGR